MDRDLLKEQSAFKSFQIKNGRDPRSDEMPTVYKSIYGDQLPAELATTSMATGGTPNQLTQNNAPGAALPALKGAVNTAQSRMEGFNTPSTALNVLQEAIKTKNNTGEAPLGTSKTFEQAGVSGWGALQASLSARADEMSQNFSNYQNVVNSMAGTYKDLATAAVNNYKIAADNYNNEIKRLDDYNKQVADNEQAIKLMQMQADITRQLELFKNQMSTGNIDMKTGNVNVAITSPSGNTYDMSTYATDPNQSKAVQNIISGIGKFNTPEEIDAYIKSTNPNSPLTSSIITSAATKNKVGWEELVGLIQHEANLATSNVSMKNNNPGGITWSQSYQDNHPGVTKGTARPASEGGYYVKFKSLQEGVDAVAQQLARRKTTGQSSALSAEDQAILNNPYELNNKTRTERDKIVDRLHKAGYTLPSEMTPELSDKYSNLYGYLNTALSQSNKSVENKQSVMEEFNRKLNSGQVDKAKEMVVQMAVESLPAGEQGAYRSTKEFVNNMEKLKVALDEAKAAGINTNIITGTAEKLARKI
jgi:hypothetical protein